MRKILVGTLMAGGMLVASQASAQMGLPVAVEVRGGAAFPTSDFDEGDSFDTGWGFEGNVQVRVLPVLAVYAGYDRFNFDRPDDALGDASFTDQGFSFGGQLSLPTAMLMGASPFIRGGGLYHQAKFDRENDALDSETERSWGYEVGGGLSVPLGQVISFTPAVRYRSYALDFGDAISVGDDFDVSTFTVDLGMKFGF